jgi:hypothetical protein
VYSIFDGDSVNLCTLFIVIFSIIVKCDFLHSDEEDDWGVAEYVEPEVKEELIKASSPTSTASESKNDDFQSLTAPILVHDIQVHLKQDSISPHRFSPSDDGLGEELTESSSSHNTSKDDKDSEDEDISNSEFANLYNYYCIV